MREQFMMYGVLSPDPNLGRYQYTTDRFPCQCLGGAILVPSFCLARLVKKYQQEICITKENVYSDLLPSPYISSIETRVTSPCCCLSRRPLVNPLFEKM